MVSPEFDYSDLTKEKKLWDIYKASRAIPSSCFNIITTAAVAVLLFINLVFGDQTIAEIVLQSRSLANMGLPLALSTLGLLLAGFTVFATISEPQLSISMSTVINQESGLSYLKHNYFTFLRVFVYYLVFSLFFLAIIMFGQKGGLVSMLVKLAPYENVVREVVIKGVNLIILTGYYFLIMQLKSFVFNIYISVMTALRWEAEKPDQDS